MINATQAALLGLLHDGPATGGELNAMAVKWLSPYFNTTRSQVYRELPGMAENGYVKAGTPGPRLSVKYKITAAGKRAFQSWLKEAPAPDLLRSEGVLRVALGRLHMGDSFQSLLNNMQNHHEEQVEELTGLLREANSEGMTHDAQAIKFSLMYHQMMIGWLDTVELPD